MTKTDLAEHVAVDTGLSKTKAKDAIDATLDAIQDSLVGGEKVLLVGFGTFDVRERSARKGVNPQTGEEMQIPAMKVPHFRAGKNLKEAVRDS